MIKNNAKLNFDELNQVAGGTVKEYEEILDAVGSGHWIGDVNSALRTIIEMLGPVGLAGKSAVYAATAGAMEKALKADLGIDAYISVGWGGTGFRSTHNRYSRDGKTLSHQEVLDIIRAAA